MVSALHETERMRNTWNPGGGGEGGEGGLEGTERGVWENGHGSKEQVMGRKGTKKETEV